MPHQNAFYDVLRLTKVLANLSQTNHICGSYTQNIILIQELIISMPHQNTWIPNEAEMDPGVSIPIIGFCAPRIRDRLSRSTNEISLLRVTWWVPAFWQTSSTIACIQNRIVGCILSIHKYAAPERIVERFEEGRGELHSFWHTIMLWRFHSRVKRRDSIHIIRHKYAALELHCLKKKNCREVCRPRAQ
jgi:hypothetical protein